MTCNPQVTCSSLKQDFIWLIRAICYLYLYLYSYHSRFMPCMPANLLTSISFVEVGEVPVAMVGLGTVGPHCHSLWHSSLHYFVQYLIYGKYTTYTECVSRQIRSFMPPEWLRKEQHSGCSITFVFEFISVPGPRLLYACANRKLRLLQRMYILSILV